jgi:hypothetical protein
MPEHYTTIDKCRICNCEELHEVLALEPQYIGSTFVKDNDTHPMAKIKVPLTLLLCKICGLVQLKETVNPELLYHDYFYRTNVNDTMKKDLKELVDSVIRKSETLEVGDCVVDIGANDMTMLSMFPDVLLRVGVEPAKNISWENVDESIHIINDYFDGDLIRKQIGLNRKVKIISSCACFYDMPDPNKTVSDIKNLLAEDGIAVIQVSYLLNTVRDMNAYDLCHEHVEYYSLETLIRLFNKYDLSVFDASLNGVNGGSLRIYATHKENKWPKSEGLRHILGRERQFKLDEVETYQKWEKDIEKLKTVVNNWLSNLEEDGGNFIGIGASTKGNVLLQLLGIDKTRMPYISDRSQAKVGLKTLGTDILLISEEEARKLNPSCMVLLPWNFEHEIIKREKEYIENGGIIFVPLPYPHYYTKEGRFMLKTVMINDIKG